MSVLAAASAVHFAAGEPLARTSEGSKSGPIGLAIILLLCVACYFLFKSMSGHLRHVREDFPKNAVPPAAPATPTASSIAASSSPDSAGEPQSPPGATDAPAADAPQPDGPAAPDQP